MFFIKPQQIPFLLILSRLVFAGVISMLKILGIIVFLKDWTTDVPSIFAVRKLNRGIEPKKSKWFNG